MADFTRDVHVPRDVFQSAFDTGFIVGLSEYLEAASAPLNLFVLESDAPFALGVDILSASNKMSKARSRMR